MLCLFFIYKHTATTVIDSWKKTGVRGGGGGRLAMVLKPQKQEQTTEQLCGTDQ